MAFTIQDTTTNCTNTLNLALSTAKRSWSTKHMGDMSAKMYEAKHTLELADEYMYNLNKHADQLANTSVADEKIHQIIEELFPIGEDASDCVKNRAEKMRNDFMVCYLAPDLIKYLGTAYGFVNAASDFATHTAPSRMTASFQENNFARVLAGHPLIDKAYSLVSAH